MKNLDLREARESTAPPKTMPLVVKVDARAKAEVALAHGADAVIVGDDGARLGGDVIFDTPRIVRDEARLRQLLRRWSTRTPAPTVNAHNLGTLLLARECGLRVQTDYDVPVYNAEAARQLAELGVVRATASPELTLAQLRALAAASPVPLDVIVGGWLELMVTARRVDGTALRDRTGAVFPLVRQSDGVRLLNSRPLSMLAQLTKLRRVPNAQLRLEGQHCNEGELARLVAAYAAYKDAATLTDDDRRRIAALEGKQFTRGHFNRGIR